MNIPLIRVLLSLAGCIGLDSPLPAVVKVTEVLQTVIRTAKSSAFGMMDIGWNDILFGICTLAFLLLAAVLTVADKSK